MESRKSIRVADIKIGNRHRKDMGDLDALAASIKAEGLLQPIGVTEKNVLVFGERRLRAVRDILGRKTIDARIVKVSSIAAGEYTENVVRKDFTVSERVAIAKTIEEAMPERRGRPKKAAEKVDNSRQFTPGQKTEQLAAERAGFGSEFTYRQAKKVIEKGAPEVIEAMDRGELAPSLAAKLAEARNGEFVAWPL